MSTTPDSPAPPAQLDPAVEDAVRAQLTSSFQSIYGERTTDFVATIMSLDHYRERFRWLFDVVGRSEELLSTAIMISGYSVGSEMIVARQFGFSRIDGVEVDPDLVVAAAARTRYLGDIHPAIYDGGILPYADSSFSLVTSGHIVEHTANPSLYLKECLRVLKPGGVLALEFPTRFHHTELHTGLPSAEWLPRRVRNPLLRLLASRVSPLSKKTKSGYESIVTTKLQQISLGLVRRYLNESGYPHSFLRIEKVSPGVIRTAIRREGASTAAVPPAAKLRFRVSETELAIAKLDPGAAIPSWATGPGFVSVTRTAHELSIVCDASLLPEGVVHERGWAMLELDGPFPFELTGILSSFIVPLAAARIGIFAMSTFDTDFVLVKRESLHAALKALAGAGHVRVD